MKNRILLLIASLVFMVSGASAQTLKWDLKPMPEGFSVPRNQLRVHDGQLIPQISMVWVHPDDEDNFEVTVMPRSLYRKANGPLCPAPGYEWVEPENLHNFAVRPVQGEAASSSESVPAGNSTTPPPPPPPPSTPTPPAHVPPSPPKPPIIYGHGPEIRLFCSGQTLPSGWVIVGYQKCNDGLWGVKMENVTTLVKGNIVQVCAQSPIPDGWKEIGQMIDGNCHQPNTVTTGNNARKIQRQ